MAEPAWFEHLARQAARWLGDARVFLGSALCILAWAASGPWLGWSDTWQLIINTSTTVLTFEAIFLIQHTQTRDTVAIQAKLDEVIRAVPQADNRKMGLERQECDE
jgi:low affinity Fe/Cu permease